MKQFYSRHIGITSEDAAKMLEMVGVRSMDELIEQTIPNNIRLSEPLRLPSAMGEGEFLRHIHSLARQNELFDNYIGLGYYGTETPAVILRNVFENPVWYTSYTPYQAEISQGRLEALFNFQTMVCDLTAMPLSNCSLLDEATAAAEAMTMMFRLRSKNLQKEGVATLLVDENLFPQTLSVLKTRALSQDIELLITDVASFQFDTPIFGAVVQYPDANGNIRDYREFCSKCHDNDAKLTVIADLMSLVLLTPPGEWDADIAVGSTQRFGLPIGYGGPAAAYLATREEFKRDIPGRIVGLSHDMDGKPAYRLALQMREQHIKREKATSNICTAQALPAIMAAFYAIYHGAEGLLDIAMDIHLKTVYLSKLLSKLGYRQLNEVFFDTLRIVLPDEVNACEVQRVLEENRINIRYIDEKTIGISLDETTSVTALTKLIHLFAKLASKSVDLKTLQVEEPQISQSLLRKSAYLTHDVFKKYRSETEMMRYIKRLERKDISLTHSMIPLGSCTMKLNAAAEMLPTVWFEFLNLHPFAPQEQAKGYQELIKNMSAYLAEITGFEAVSLQPTSGAAGEYASLVTIRNYFYSTNQEQRRKMLIPVSAHGTNPASAAQAGFTVVTVACDEKGNVDVDDLRQKAEQLQSELAGLMITYPSTHGIFEPEIREICDIVHQYGGLVFMDGANMNGQVGLTSPKQIGADTCHLNLHKTFASPHGGGGPGVGAIGTTAMLGDYMPQHLFTSDDNRFSAVSAAPWGNVSLLPIAYGYIRMMGAEGLTLATKTAILSANYLAKKLEKYYGIVYTGATGRVGHELILDCRQFKSMCGITETDIAKRLMDYGFHAPTLSFPVHGTLMIEPTESESLAELDRFAEALIAIRNEIDEIAEGKHTQDNNVLVNAPHAEYKIVANDWNYPYSRSKAAFPLDWVTENKFWIPVGRVDNGAGDRNLICKQQ
ncbi:MAG TPA: aminomethyl-transferring glycine dehydrogenase [Paludibacteraceae bacterium]|nr:aminomethyl-transferring glycine dehydrogenase [Paludibacteraceae bacterium]